MGNPIALHSCQHAALLNLKHFASLETVDGHLIVILMCVLLATTDIGHLSTFIGKNIMF
jgi:hypothetical protein